ncbi:hypothetical protein ABRP55_13760 [Pectobacterium zantedeschiae]|uniref:hypothetical protein n=1 Tax=Pectobacterium zantedeschiae TaxID=2034769 RepID=UPI0032EE2B01
MSYFGLNYANQNQALDTASRSPIGTGSDVGFFDNAASSAAAGLYSGLVAKTDQALWGGIDAAITPVAQFTRDNLGINDTSDQFTREQRRLAEQQVRRLTPDTGTTGTAGLVLHGLFDMGAQAVVGTALAGPVGGAAAVTSIQGFSEFERLRAQGVDLNTAQEVGLIHGVTAGAGTLIPMSLGLRAGGALAEGVGAQLARSGESAFLGAAATVARAAPDITYAAGTNIAFGMAQRGLTAQALRRGGYQEMASQYDVLDKQAIAIDAVLGVAFGGIGRFLNAKGESVRNPDFSPSDIDVALAANASHHAEIDVAPGIPINVLSRDAHIAALRQSMRNISEGNSVDIASIIQPASFSELPSRRNLIAQSLDEVLLNAEQGSSARAAETRMLEEQAAQVLPRGDRQVYQSEIANSQRIIDNLTEERSQLLTEEPKGSGKNLSQARSDKQAKLRDIDRRIDEAKGRLDFSRNALAPHEPGGTFFEARAELARRQQAEIDLDAQAISFYRTPDVINASEISQPDNVRASDNVDPQPTHDIDIRYAENSLAASPDMLITVLDDDGNPQSRSARELLDEANMENERAIQDANLFDVAVACFLRG